MQLTRHVHNSYCKNRLRCVVRARSVHFLVQTPKNLWRDILEQFHYAIKNSFGLGWRRHQQQQQQKLFCSLGHFYKMIDLLLASNTHHGSAARTSRNTGSTQATSRVNRTMLINFYVFILLGEHALIKQTMRGKENSNTKNENFHSSSFSGAKKKKHSIIIIQDYLGQQSNQDA